MILLDTRAIGLFGAGVLMLVGCVSIDQGRPQSPSAGAVRRVDVTAPASTPNASNAAARKPRRRVSPRPAAGAVDVSEVPSSAEVSEQETGLQFRAALSNPPAVAQPDEPRDPEQVSRVATPLVHEAESAEAVSPSEDVRESRPGTGPAGLGEFQADTAMPEEAPDEPAPAGFGDTNGDPAAGMVDPAPAHGTPDLQAQLPPLIAIPAGPYRMRAPLFGQGCGCPYDVEANGRVCGSQSEWVRPGGLDPACYGDPWGQTAIFACFGPGDDQALLMAPMRFCGKS